MSAAHSRLRWSSPRPRADPADAVAGAPVSAPDPPLAPPEAAPAESPAPAPRPKRPHRWRYRAALAVVLAGALALRLWGIKQGLPFAYNTDENSHFVPYAIGMFIYGF